MVKIVLYYNVSHKYDLKFSRNDVKKLRLILIIGLTESSIQNIIVTCKQHEKLLLRYLKPFFSHTNL